MKTTKQMVLLLTLTVSGAMARPGQGGGSNNGPQGGPPPGGGFVARLDQNGDGQISAGEFDGPAEHFSTFDRNGDGYISGQEAPARPPRGGQEDASQERPAEREHRSGEASGSRDECPEPAGFTSRLDQDRDGRVSESEFDGPEGAFEQLDRNGDGFISEQEAPKGPPRNQE